MPVNPKVSVLIPTYNYGHFLDETIGSVLAQTFTDFELLVVDNCSTDNTEAVVAKYLDDPRVTYHRNTHNLGLPGNWNRCLELARGEYIKFLCADDKFHPLLLERFVAVLEQNPNVVLVTSHSEMFGDYAKVRRQPHTGVVSGDFARRDMLKVGARNWFGEPSTVMFRRTGLAAGKFNMQLHGSIDLDFYMRLFQLGDCYVIPEVLSYFRLHEGMVTANVRRQKYEAAFESYRFTKAMQAGEYNRFGDALVDIRPLVRLRAERCATIMYKTLLSIYKPHSLKYFKQGLSVGLKEGVLFSPLLKLIWNKGS